MKTEQFFVSSGVADPASARWHEAFPHGQALGLSTVLARLRGASAAAGLVWLSSGDEQWAAHLQQVLQARPATPVVLLSSAPEPQQGLSAINGGARGYTHAYAVPALLQEVALVVEHGGLWVGPELLQRLVGSTQAALAARRPAAGPAQGAPSDKVWASLSAREAEVARAVSQGRSNKEVADLMHISERTVKAHLGAVFEKLGVRDRLQLVLRLATATDSAAPAPEKLP